MEQSLQKKNMNKAAIIGAGIAGIASAIRLAKKGFEVQVFEANRYPGGKLSQFVSPKGFRFDAGPSLFTLPEQVEELFKLCGENPEAHFDYVKLPVACHYFFEDGTFLQAHADHEAFAQEMQDKLGEPRENVVKALKNSAFLYETLAPLFMHKSLHHSSTFFNQEAFKAYGRMPRLDFFRTMDRANKSFFKDPRSVQLFNRYATYNGSDPYQTPATLNIIPHLEFNIGAFFPTQGMVSITNSLVALAERQGVKFHYGQGVEKILVENKKAKGIRLAGKDLNFDLVVSNMDVVNTYQKLLKEQKQPEKLLRQPKSSSALIFYWSMGKTFPQLDLHNILFSADYEKEFEHIFKKKSLYDDPTVYINITSKYKKDDAPEGCENWFTMINVPNNQGQDWDRLIAEARENIIKKTSRLLQTDIRPLILEEEYLDPRRIESKTSSWQGALYGNSSNNKYAAFLRHANFHKDIEGLYFCGGSVHPGGGIPLCLLSAKIMSEEVS